MRSTHELAVAILTVVPVCGSSHAAPSTACEQLENALGVLEEGTFEAKWLLLDHELPGVNGLSDLQNTALAECRDRAIGSMLNALRHDSDDRIVARVMDGIDWKNVRTFDDFLVQALDNPSPNLRRRAAGVIADVGIAAALPQIERRWETEDVEWVRPALARAIGTLGDGSRVEEFNRLACGDPGMLANAAAEAIIRWRRPESVPTLEAVARRDNGYAGYIAIDALAEWSDMPVAADAILRLALSEDERVSDLVVSKMIDDNVSTEWLTRVQRLGRNPGAVEQVTSELERRGDQIESIRFRCGGVHVEPERALPLLSGAGGYADYGSFRARSTPGHATVRCWDGPAVFSSQHMHRRVPDGARVYVADVFAWRDELWYACGSQTDVCWIPADALIPVEDYDLGEPAADIELDVPVDALAAEGFRRAERIGFATTFDETPDVVGVRFDAPTGDREMILNILETRDRSEGPAREAIDDWLTRNEGAWVRDLEISTRIHLRTAREPSREEVDGSEDSDDPDHPEEP